VVDSSSRAAVAGDDACHVLRAFALARFVGKQRPRRIDDRSSCTRAALKN